MDLNPLRQQHKPSAQAIGALPSSTTNSPAQVATSHATNLLPNPTNSRDCFHLIFENQVHKQRNDLSCFLTPKQSLTYQACNELANQLAHYLYKEGLPYDGIVGVCTDFPQAFPFCRVAIRKAAGLVLPIYPNATDETQKSLLKNYQLCFVITQTYIQQQQIRKLLEEINQKSVKFICLETVLTLINSYPKTKLRFPPNSPHNIHLAITIINQLQSDVLKQRLEQCFQLLRSNLSTADFKASQKKFSQECEEIYIDLNNRRDPTEEISFLPDKKMDPLDKTLFNALCEFMYVRSQKSLQYDIKNNSLAFSLDSLLFIKKNALFATAGATKDLVAGVAAAIMNELQKKERNYFHKIFERQVEISPGNPALVYPGEPTLNYRELNMQCNQLAHYLLQNNISGGDYVGLYLDSTPTAVKAIIATMKCGAAYLPLDPRFPDDRLINYLKQCQPKIIITESIIQKQKIQVLIQNAQTLKTEIICIEESQKILSTMPTNNPAIAINPDQIMYAIFTSGSTGQPKGVPCPYYGIHSRINAHIKIMQITDRDRFALHASLAFDMSLMIITTALACGASLYPVPFEKRLNSTELGMYYLNNQLTIGFFTPSFLSVMNLNYLHNLHAVLIAGEGITKKLVENLYNMPHGSAGFNVILGYGTTEGGICQTLGICEKNEEIHAGNPIPEVKCFVLEISDKPDVEKRPVADGEEGELYTAGPGHAKMYINNPVLSRERFVEITDPNTKNIISAYRTYDTVKFKYNTFYINGRCDDQVKVCGQLANPEEIRLLLGNFPSIKNAFIDVIDKETYFPKFNAYIELNEPQKPIDFVEIHQALARMLPPYLLPRGWAVVKAIPINIFTGKIDKAGIKKLIAEITPQIIAPVQMIAPRNDLETAIANVWKEVINLNFLPFVNSEFTFLGGQSLQYLQICQKLMNLKSEYACVSDLLYVNFLHKPTISAMARFIRRRMEKIEPRLITLMEDRSQKNAVKLSPCFIIPPITCSPETDYASLKKNWSSNRALISFELLGLNNLEVLPETIEEFAISIVETIQKYQPKGPYLIAGYSSGVPIALEITKQLELNREQAGLIIIDEESPHYIQSINIKEHAKRVITLATYLAQFLAIPYPAIDIVNLEQSLSAAQITKIFAQLHISMTSQQMDEKVRIEKTRRLKVMEALALAELTYHPISMPAYYHLFVGLQGKPDNLKDLGWPINQPNILHEFPYDHMGIIQAGEVCTKIQNVLNVIEAEFKLAQLKEQLNTRYTNEEFAYINRLFADEKHQRAPIDTAFVNLAIVKQKEQLEIEQTSMRKARSDQEAVASIDEFSNTAERITFDFQLIFNPINGKRPRRILITGKPGTGKSTLCQRILYLFANKKLFNQYFDLIIVIAAKNLTANRYQPGIRYSLVDLLQRECLDQLGLGKNISREELQLYLDIIKDRVCVVIDSVEDLPDDSPCADVIKSIVHDQHIHVLVTSNRYIKTLFPSSLFDLHLENIGFTNQDIPLYLHQYYINDENKNTTVKEIMKFLQQDPSTYSLGHYPLNMELICAIWHESLANELHEKSTLKTTELYCKIETKLWRRFFNKIGKPDRETLRRKHLAEELLELLAFRSLQNNLIVIGRDLFCKTVKEVYKNEGVKADEDIEVVIEEIIRPGFLASADKSTSEIDKSRYFIHYRFHIFFAAKYFVRVYTDKSHPQYTAILEMFSKTKFDTRYEFFWWFVSGLLAKDYSDIYLPQFISDLANNPKDIMGFYYYSLLVRCLDEARMPAHLPQTKAICALTQWLGEDVNHLKLFIPVLKMSSDVLKKSKLIEVLYQQFEETERILLETPKSKLTKDNIQQASREELTLFTNKYFAPSKLSNIIELLSLLGCTIPEFMDKLDLYLDPRLDIEELKNSAFQALANMSVVPPKLITDACKNFNSSNFDTRIEAHKAIIAFKVMIPELFAALKQQVNHTDSQYQLRAIKTIGEIGIYTKEVVDLLKLKLNFNVESKIRNEALIALTKLRPINQQVSEIIYATAVDMDPILRRTALESIVARGLNSKFHVSIILGLLSDSEKIIRILAARSLVKLQQITPELLYQVVKLLEQDDPLFRCLIAEAIGIICAPPPNGSGIITPEILAALSRRLDDPKEKDFVKEAIINSIANMSEITPQLLRSLFNLIDQCQPVILKHLPIAELHNHPEIYTVLALKVEHSTRNNEMALEHLESFSTDLSYLPPTLTTITSEITEILREYLRSNHPLIQEFAKLIIENLQQPIPETIQFINNRLSSSDSIERHYGICLTARFLNKHPQYFQQIQISKDLWKQIFEERIGSFRTEFLIFVNKDIVMSMTKQLVDVNPKYKSAVVRALREIHAAKPELIANDEVVNIIIDELSKPGEFENKKSYHISLFELLRDTNFTNKKLTDFLISLIAKTTITEREPRRILLQYPLRVVGSMFGKMTAANCKKFIKEAKLHEFDLEIVLGATDQHKILDIYLSSDSANNWQLLIPFVKKLLEMRAALYFDGADLICHELQLNKRIASADFQADFSRDFHRALKEYAGAELCNQFQKIIQLSPSVPSSAASSSGFIFQQPQKPSAALMLTPADFQFLAPESSSQKGQRPGRKK